MIVIGQSVHFSFNIVLKDQVSEPPAVVIYMIDPFSYGVDNIELQRLSSMALLRCFSDILYDQRIPDSIRQSVYLQTVSLETVYSIASTSPVITPTSIILILMFRRLSTIWLPDVGVHPASEGVEVSSPPQAALHVRVHPGHATKQL